MAYPDANEKSHGEIAAQNLKNPHVVQSISKEAELLGLSKKSCLETIKEGLAATKLYFKNNGRSQVEHPDHSTRIKAAELGLRIHGDLNPSNVMVNVGSDALEFCKDFFSSERKNALKHTDKAGA